MPPEIEHLQVAGNGIKLHLATCGNGPLVIMLHGFPGLWYTWRKQMPVLAEAGYRAVALDLRGYGRSDRPTDVTAYDSQTQVADVLAVMDHFSAPRAIIMGQDFGARLAWNVCARAPRRVVAAVIFGVPYDFNRAGREPGGAGLELSGLDDLPPSRQFAAVAEEHFFHMHYFQDIGPAEAELNPRARDLLLRLYWALSAEGSLLDWRNYPSVGTGYLDVLAEPAKPLPWAWFSEEDLDYLVGEYSSAGPELTFSGGFNAYRVLDINWRNSKVYRNVEVPAPVLYIMGTEDPVGQMMPAVAYEHMRRLAPNLRGEHFIEGAGHFVMQEQPIQVNQLMLDFLAEVGRN